jgi:hypothetical protein
MSLSLYSIGLVIHLLVWALLFLLAMIFAKKLHRRREAKGLPRGASWVQFRHRNGSCISYHLDVTICASQG